MPAATLRSGQVVILGAGRGVRGGVPSAIVDIDENGRVLDWLLDAFAVLDRPDFCFVGGFKADEVVERYPRLRVVFNRDWDSTGPVRSLGLVSIDTAVPTYVCYSDVVFGRSAVEALRRAEGEVVIAVDTRWRARYEGRGAGDLDGAEKVRLEGRRVRAIGPTLPTAAATAEFAGVLRLGPAATEVAFQAIRSGAFAPTAALPELVRFLVDRGVEVNAVDLEGAWAELDAKQDLARFVLGTKAESLERLRGLSHGGEIGALVTFTAAEWREAREATIRKILETLGGDRLIVRSSALAEDGWLDSAAGRYESVLDVGREPLELGRAVDDVFASYGVGTALDQVLVQEMLEGVVMSGVVMTRTHSLGAPYYVTNFDDSSSRTDTVTGGRDSRTVFTHRGSPVRPELPSALTTVLSTVQNIEKLVGHDSLDIEFAVTDDARTHILQVRPIAVDHTPEPIDDEQVASALAHAREFLADRHLPMPTLLGGSTRYSVMSDWNPAEIIGTKPRRLALSLYRRLVTDEVWAQQRAEYGYRDVRPCPLLVDIVGHPYVDVRATFNSFVPAGLSDDLARRLVDHYLEYLSAHPSLHDKVEFQVLFTCLTVDFDEASRRLVAAGFSETDVSLLRARLRQITAEGFARADRDLDELATLDARVLEIRSLELRPLDRAFWLLDAARRFGTPAFAHLARAAFVATSLLRSLENVGAVSREQNDAFLASVETVLGRLRSDGARVAAGELPWASFVEEYGHLRPGTYDIRATSYRSAPEQYLRPLAGRRPDQPVEVDHEIWGPKTRGAISKALGAVGLPDDVDAFEHFVRTAIAGREEAKFSFTRAVSDALDAFAAFGDAQGLSRDDLSHLTVDDLLGLRDVRSDPEGLLRRRVLEGREAYLVAQGVCLPSQISSASDLVCFEQEPAEPNFVTQRAVEARIVAQEISPDASVEGAIVMIPNADPGYDWLLARGLAGLITMYGGANSHMAVRAAETRLPAAIGVGELLYRKLEPAGTVRLDCASRTITIVS